MHLLPVPVPTQLPTDMGIDNMIRMHCALCELRKPQRCDAKQELCAAQHLEARFANHRRPMMHKPFALSSIHDALIAYHAL